MRHQTRLWREGSKGSEGKVDGPPGRRLWPPVGGRLCSLRSGGDSACGAEGGGLPLRAMLIKSALRIYLSVSYGMIGILRIDSLRSPPKGGTAEWYMKYMTLRFSSPYFSFPLEVNASKRQRVYKAEQRCDTLSLS